MYMTRTSTGMEALEPRMTKVCVTRISTFLKPSTAASAAAAQSRFVGNAALGTRPNDVRLLGDVR